MYKEQNLDFGIESAVLQLVKGTKAELLWDMVFTLLHRSPRWLPGTKLENPRIGPISSIYNLRNFKL